MLPLLATYSIISQLHIRSTTPRFIVEIQLTMGTVVSSPFMGTTWDFRWTFSAGLGSVSPAVYIVDLTGNVRLELLLYSPSVACYHYTTFPLSLLSHLFSIYIIAKNFYFCKYFSHLLSSSQGVLLLPMSWREVGLHLP